MRYGQGETVNIGAKGPVLKVNLLVNLTSTYGDITLEVLLPP